MAKKKQINNNTIGKVMRVRITFVDEVLGTAAADPEVHKKYIASKAPDAPSKEEEVAALGVEEVVENSMTVFSRDTDGTPVLWNYQILGFFKSACSALSKVKDTKSSKLKAYKKNIDLRIKVFADINDKAGRKIRIENIGEIGNCQRPLRANTAQGERIALANSETIPAGAYCEFDINTLVEDDMDMVCEWLDYGIYNGIGQWRNSGKGAFIWEEVSV